MLDADWVFADAQTQPGQHYVSFLKPFGKNMKRHISDENKLKLLRMLDDFSRTEGLALNDKTTQKKFIDRISKTIKKHGDNPALIHGFRIESMFAHIAAALGESKILTEEDSGAFFSLNENIRRPDFRLITRAGEEYLIEVKNFHQKDPLNPYKIKTDYLDSISNYAELFGVPLKIALYWSRWKLWTLIDSKYFNRNKSDFSISIFDAMKRNEMSIIGDCMIGTIPPLSFRVYADPEKSRTIDANGKVHFTIKKAAIFSNGIELVDELEKKLAWFFWLHGRWENTDETAQVDKNLLDYTEFSVSPVEWDKTQGFAMLGYLSEMISSQYNLRASTEGQVRTLSPNLQPNEMGVLIPLNYKGKVLKLWRFKLLPNYDDIEKREANIRLHEDRS